MKLSSVQLQKCDICPKGKMTKLDGLTLLYNYTYIINLRCICICVCIFAHDCARCPIPMHSEGCRFQMAMLTSQFSAQRVGGAYLVITLEDLHIVPAWTQIPKQLGLLPMGGTYFVITLAHQLTQTIMSASTNTKFTVLNSTFKYLV